MIYSLIREIFAMFGEHVDDQINRLSHRLLNIALALGLAIAAMLFVFMGFAFLGLTLYRLLYVCYGPVFSPLIACSFFLLIALFMLLISKKFINKR